MISKTKTGFFQVRFMKSNSASLWGQAFQTVGDTPHPTLEDALQRNHIAALPEVRAEPHMCSGLRV